MINAQKHNLHRVRLELTTAALLVPCANQLRHRCGLIIHQIAHLYDVRMEFTPIVNHLRTLVTMINQTAPEHWDKSWFVTYLQWKYEPKFPNIFIKFDSNTPNSLRDYSTPSITSNSIVHRYPHKLDCVLLLGDVVNRERKQTKEELAGCESLIIFVDLLYGFSTFENYTSISEWYNLIWRELYLQPCPRTNDPKIGSSQFGVAATIPRFISDPRARRAVMLSQLDKFAKYYPNSSGILAWVPQSLSIKQARFCLKLAKIKSLTDIYKGLRRTQLRQIKFRIESLGGKEINVPNVDRLTKKLNTLYFALKNDQSLFKNGIAYKNLYSQKGVATHTSIERFSNVSVADALQNINRDRPAPIPKLTK